MVSGRLRLELSLTVRGGLAILDRDRVPWGMMSCTDRPHLEQVDKARHPAAGQLLRRSTMNASATAITRSSNTSFYYSFSLLPKAET